jgi:hypothetical protein
VDALRQELADLRKEVAALQERPTFEDRDDLTYCTSYFPNVVCKALDDHDKELTALQEEVAALRGQQPVQIPLPRAELERIVQEAMRRGAAEALAQMEPLLQEAVRKGVAEVLAGLCRGDRGKA